MGRRPPVKPSLIYWITPVPISRGSRCLVHGVADDADPDTLNRWLPARAAPRIDETTNERKIYG
jgi:hypothetical protein